MRAGLLGLLLLAGPAAGQGVDRMHGGQTFRYAEVELDYGRQAARDLLNWDAQGWLGTDYDKLWLRSEGEHAGGRLERGEVQLLWSRNLGGFFDLQTGARVDVRPDRRGYLVAGVQGLAPYQLDSQAHLFVSERGDVHVRARQRVTLLLTNRLSLTPMVEADLYLTDAPERRVVAGFSRIETGVQGRWEPVRKFSPYVAVLLDRKLGGTARLARADGEAVGGWLVRSGLRVWF